MLLLLLLLLLAFACFVTAVTYCGVLAERTAFKESIYLCTVYRRMKDNSVTLNIVQYY